MMLVMVMVMVVLMTSQVSGARCCGPRQWAGEVRRVTVNTTLPDTSDTPEWHWVSYDFDTKKVAVITFDPRPGKSDLYRRELLDFSEGMRYVTQDEVTCRSSRLNGTIPRLCVPPSGGLVWQHTQWNNLTLTVNPESFNMPKSCFTTSPDTVTTAGAQIPTAYGRMAQILNLL
ncbi:uncharacterized protein LOC143278070 isoform X2 [Babylonia areolata]|uniref:uncharacterized protein LOC143278070 isoform X2 n=1 Tax=Babylonia areolata TaxID=304850 RepID=UPI003FCFDD37